MRIKYLPIIITAIFLFFHGCDGCRSLPKSEVADFEIIGEGEQSTVHLEDDKRVQFSVHIVPKNEIAKGVAYYQLLDWEVLGGLRGELFVADGQKVTGDTKLKNGENIFFYEPGEIGDHTIKLQVTDKYHELEKEVTLPCIIVEKMPTPFFKVTLQAGSLDVFNHQTAQINLDITSEDLEAKGLGYTVKSVEVGQGSFYFENGEEVQIGSKLIFGTQKLIFKPTKQVGTTKIKLTVGNGRSESSAGLFFEVKSLSLAVDLKSSSEYTFTHRTSPIILEVSSKEECAKDLAYTIKKIQVSRGELEFEGTGKKVEVGSQVQYGTQRLIFKPSGEIGQARMELTVSSTETGIENLGSLALEVKSLNFKPNMWLREATEEEKKLILGNFAVLEVMLSSIDKDLAGEIWKVSEWKSSDGIQRDILDNEGKQLKEFPLKALERNQLYLKLPDIKLNTNPTLTVQIEGPGKTIQEAVIGLAPIQRDIVAKKEQQFLEAVQKKNKEIDSCLGLPVRGSSYGIVREYSREAENQIASFKETLTGLQTSYAGLGGNQLERLAKEITDFEDKKTKLDVLRKDSKKRKASFNAELKLVSKTILNHKNIDLPLILSSDEEEARDLSYTVKALEATKGSVHLESGEEVKVGTKLTFGAQHLSFKPSGEAGEAKVKITAGNNKGHESNTSLVLGIKPVTFKAELQADTKSFFKHQNAVITLNITSSDEGATDLDYKVKKLEVLNGELHFGSDDKRVDIDSPVRFGWQTLVFKPTENIKGEEVKAVVNLTISNGKGGEHTSSVVLAVKPIQFKVSAWLKEPKATERSLMTDNFAMLEVMLSGIDKELAEEPWKVIGYKFSDGVERALLDKELKQLKEYSLKAVESNQLYLKLPDIKLDKEPTLTFQVEGPGETIQEVIVNLDPMQKAIVKDKIENSLKSSIDLARKIDDYLRLPVSGENYLKAKELSIETTQQIAEVKELLGSDVKAKLSKEIVSITGELDELEKKKEDLDAFKQTCQEKKVAFKTELNTPHKSFFTHQTALIDLKLTSIEQEARGLIYTIKEIEATKGKLHFDQGGEVKAGSKLLFGHQRLIFKPSGEIGEASIQLTVENNKRAESHSRLILEVKPISFQVAASVKALAEEDKQLIPDNLGIVEVRLSDIDKELTNDAWKITEWKFSDAMSSGQPNLCLQKVQLPGIEHGRDKQIQQSINALLEKTDRIERDLKLAEEEVEEAKDEVGIAKRGVESAEKEVRGKLESVKAIEVSIQEAKAKVTAATEKVKEAEEAKKKILAEAEEAKKQALAKIEKEKIAAIASKSEEAKKQARGKVEEYYRKVLAKIEEEKVETVTAKLKKASEQDLIKFRAKEQEAKNQAKAAADREQAEAKAGKDYQEAYCKLEASLKQALAKAEEDYPRVLAKIAAEGGEIATVEAETDYRKAIAEAEADYRKATAEIRKDFIEANAIIEADYQKARAEGSIEARKQAINKINERGNQLSFKTAEANRQAEANLEEAKKQARGKVEEYYRKVLAKIEEKRIETAESKAEGEEIASAEAKFVEAKRQALAKLEQAEKQVLVKAEEHIKNNKERLKESTDDLRMLEDKLEEGRGALRLAELNEKKQKEHLQATEEGSKAAEEKLKRNQEKFNLQKNEVDKKIQGRELELEVEKKLRDTKNVTLTSKPTLLTSELDELAILSLSSQERNKFYLKFPIINLDKETTLKLQVEGPGKATKEVGVSLSEIERMIVTKKMGKALEAVTKLSKEMDVYKQLSVSGNNYSKIKSFIQDSETEFSAIFKNIEASCGCNWWENPMLLALHDVQSLVREMPSIRKKKEKLNELKKACKQKGVSFEAELQASSRSLFTHQTAPISLNITSNEQGVEGLNYTIQDIEVKNGELFFENGHQVMQGSKLKYGKGKLSFKSKGQIGHARMKITVSNGKGSESSAMMVLDVEPVSFKAELQASSRSLFTHQTAPINLEITSNEKEAEGLDYTIEDIKVKNGQLFFENGHQVMHGSKLKYGKQKLTFKPRGEAKEATIHMKLDNGKGSENSTGLVLDIKPINFRVNAWLKEPKDNDRKLMEGDFAVLEVILSDIDKELAKESWKLVGWKFSGDQVHSAFANLGRSLEFYKFEKSLDNLLIEGGSENKIQEAINKEVEKKQGFKKQITSIYQYGEALVNKMQTDQKAINQAENKLKAITSSYQPSMTLVALHKARFTEISLKEQKQGLGLEARQLAKEIELQGKRVKRDTEVQKIQDNKTEAKLKKLQLALEMKRKLKTAQNMAPARSLQPILMGSGLEQLTAYSLNIGESNQFFLSLPRLDIPPSLTLQVEGPGKTIQEVVVDLATVLQPMAEKRVAKALEAVTKFSNEVDTHLRLPVTSSNYEKLRLFNKSAKSQFKEVFKELEAGYGLEWWKNPLIMSLKDVERIVDQIVSLENKKEKLDALKKSCKERKFIFKVDAALKEPEGEKIMGGDYVVLKLKLSDIDESLASENWKLLSWQCSDLLPRTIVDKGLNELAEFPLNTKQENELYVKLPKLELARTPTLMLQIGVVGKTTQEVVLELGPIQNALAGKEISKFLEIIQKLNTEINSYLNLSTRDRRYDKLKELRIEAETKINLYQGVYKIAQREFQSDPKNLGKLLPVAAAKDLAWIIDKEMPTLKVNEKKLEIEQESWDNAMDEVATLERKSREECIENIYTRNKYGDLLIHRWTGSSSISSHAYKFIVQKTRDLEGSNDSYYAPLQIAVIYSNYTHTKLLLEHGADPNNRYCGSRHSQGDASLLIHAIKQGSLSIVEELLNYGANVNYTMTSKKGISIGMWTEESFWTALHIAAARGDENIIKHLLKKGAENQGTWMWYDEGKNRYLSASDVATWSDYKEIAILIEDYQ